MHIAALAKIFPTKGAASGSGLAASQYKLAFVKELRLGVFPAQGYNFFRSEEVWWLAVRIRREKPFR